MSWHTRDPDAGISLTPTLAASFSEKKKAKVQQISTGRDATLAASIG